MPEVSPEMWEKLSPKGQSDTLMLKNYGYGKIRTHSFSPCTWTTAHFVNVWDVWWLHQHDRSQTDWCNKNRNDTYNNAYLSVEPSDHGIGGRFLINDKKKIFDGPIFDNTCLTWLGEIGNLNQ